ncbi:TBC1 domain family member 25 [Leptopilina boulardi]|uniref:TBC1 domain family member 25 n=1 Tax=Leptopilina boulardi TaxID=63433 RepID=UPI0021F560F1|nr:TBC1 domain family member 25 [Leptopilina boulardi]
MFSSIREAVRVKVKKCETLHQPEYRKFSVDPQITSIEVLQSILIKAFDIKGDFSISYRAIDDYGSETYLFLLSDWDLDAAFISASEPYLYLQVNLKPLGKKESFKYDYDESLREVSTRQTSTGFPCKTQKLPGLILNKVLNQLSRIQTASNAATSSLQMERTFNLVQRALGNLADDNVEPPRPPLTDTEFRKFLDPIGQIIYSKELRAVIYFGGVEPSLRKVVWKHLLNVYPNGMSGRERIDYMKRKAQEYENLKEKWKSLIHQGQNVGDIEYVTNMVRKDVLRTDRHHKFYAGSDDNQNIASLFNILTTYALNHPSISYCQGMSDLASPLLVMMRDEAQAYICLCALMRRLKDNFMLDGITMTTKFAHLSEGIQYYDPQFYAYLKSHQADDLLFTYRWLLLEMKREFALDDALRMLEVSWAALPALPPIGELSLTEAPFPPSSPQPSSGLKQIRGNAYTKVCAIRRQSSLANIATSKRGQAVAEESVLESDYVDSSLEKSSSGPTSSKELPSEMSTNAKLMTNKNIYSKDESLSTENLSNKSPTIKVNLREELSLVDGGQKVLELNESEKKSLRVVKNLNEFLNFTSSNRSKVMSADNDHQQKEISMEMTDAKSLNDSSPDDLTDFYPMTTALTKELKLEIESLNRQVFGPSSSNIHTYEENKANEFDECQVETSEDNYSSADTEFSWRNPMWKLEKENNLLTSNEHINLENSEDGQDENGITSVTPVRLFKYSLRPENCSEGVGTDNVKIESTQISIQEQCQEATEIMNLIPSGASEDALTGYSLPPPNEFGRGNPFLMFLCITLLLQHRDYVMRNQMDYNEMAMHFDKMVRRHNVTKVLNQARQLFAGYMRTHSKSDYINV